MFSYEPGDILRIEERQTCIVHMYSIRVKGASICPAPQAACPQMAAAQSGSSQVCVDGGAAFCEVFESTGGRTCTEYCGESDLACLDGWDEVSGTCERWMEGYTDAARTHHDFGIGGCDNPFGGQICRCGQVSACGVYSDFPFSWVEIGLALYHGGILAHRPEQPDWEERDRFLLSKGHGCLTLYALLADRGYFPRHELGNFVADGALLAGHPDPAIPGAGNHDPPREPTPPSHTQEKQKRRDSRKTWGVGTPGLPSPR